MAVAHSERSPAEMAAAQCGVDVAAVHCIQLAGVAQTCWPAGLPTPRYAIESRRLQNQSTLLNFRWRCCYVAQSKRKMRLNRFVKVCQVHVIDMMAVSGPQDSVYLVCMYPRVVHALERTSSISLCQAHLGGKAFEDSGRQTCLKHRL